MKHMQLQITEHFITFKRFWCCGYRLDGILVVVFSGARQLVWSGLDAGGQSSSPESSVAHLHREVLAGFILCLFFVFVFFCLLAGRGAWSFEDHGALLAGLTKGLVFVAVSTGEHCWLARIHF